MGSLGQDDYGDFVDSEDDIDVETEAEPRVRYADPDEPYCPIRIGEVVDDRYRVEHKLGFGSFSTVWLAHDIQQNASVALKILTRGEAGEKERRVQDTIIESVKDSSKLITYQATFYLVGNKGNNHLVFVYPVRGPNLDTLLRQQPRALRMGAARDLLLTLKNLHDAKFIHNGEWIYTLNHCQPCAKK